MDTYFIESKCSPPGEKHQIITIVIFTMLIIFCIFYIGSHYEQQTTNPSVYSYAGHSFVLAIILMFSRDGTLIWFNNYMYNDLPSISVQIDNNLSVRQAHVMLTQHKNRFLFQTAFTTVVKMMLRCLQQRSRALTVQQCS